MAGKKWIPIFLIMGANILLYLIIYFLGLKNLRIVTFISIRIRLKRIKLWNIFGKNPN